MILMAKGLRLRIKEFVFKPSNHAMYFSGEIIHEKSEKSEISCKSKKK